MGIERSGARGEPPSAIFAAPPHPGKHKQRRPPDPHCRHFRRARPQPYTLPSDARNRSTDERTSAVPSSFEAQPSGSTVTPSNCL